LGFSDLRVLVTSICDPASLNIKQVLIDEYGFKETSETFDGFPILVNTDGVKLVTSARDMVQSNHLEEKLSADVYIFCSRHRAESGKPALLVHSTGNLGSEALFGGDPFSLSVSVASLVATALKTLQEEKESRNLEEFDVTMEATHHGPTSMNTPMLFVELGSDEKYWAHKEGARAVASAAIRCTKAQIEKESFIGFGGTHYVSKFNKLVLEKELIIGHMASKYALTDIPVSVVKQMVSRSDERVTRAVIDWKGTNQEQRAHLLPILDDLGIELVRAKEL